MVLLLYLSQRNSLLQFKLLNIKAIKTHYSILFLTKTVVQILN